MAKYLLYLVRWQLSTPLLALIMRHCPVGGAMAKAVIANLMGGLLFFWVDRLIFKRKGKQHERMGKGDTQPCGNQGLVGE